MKKRTTDNKNYVPALGYHRLTVLYDWVAGFAGRSNRLMHALMLQAQLGRADQVLDVGCGTGSLAILIKRNYPKITISALDCDQNILTIAGKKADSAQVDIQFHRAFAESLPYPDESFDRVVSTLFFHHLSWHSKKQAAGEIFRVLKPGGELHVLDWGRANNWLMRTLFIAVKLVDGYSNTQDNVSGRLIELFAQTGLTQVNEQQSFNTVFGTLVLYSAVKKGSGTA